MLACVCQPFREGPAAGTGRYGTALVAPGYLDASKFSIVSRMTFKIWIVLTRLSVRAARHVWHTTESGRRRSGHVGVPSSIEDAVALSFAIGSYYTVVLDIIPVLESTKGCGYPDRSANGRCLSHSSSVCYSLFHNLSLFVPCTNSNR